MVISMESTDQIFHLSMFSDSNSFMTMGPGQVKFQSGQTYIFIQCPADK